MTRCCENMRRGVTRRLAFQKLHSKLKLNLGVADSFFGKGKEKFRPQWKWQQVLLRWLQNQEQDFLLSCCMEKKKQRSVLKAGRSENKKCLWKHRREEQKIIIKEEKSSIKCMFYYLCQGMSRTISAHSCSWIPLLPPPAPFIV